MKKFLMMLMALLLATAACAEGFVGMANPWIATTQEDLEARTGMHLRVPEGATDVLWRVLTTADLAEMRFTLDDISYTARAVQAEHYRDISGMYYNWIMEEECRIAGLEGLMQITWLPGEKVVLCQWYDEAAEVMFSLASRGANHQHEGVLAVAEEISAPHRAQSLAAALADCTGMAGSAGATLKRAVACTDLLRYAVLSGAAECDPAVLAATAPEAWTLLTPDQQAELALNLPAMDDLLTAADPLAGDVFADAGVAEEAAALLAEGALSHWTALYGAIVPLLPAE